MFGDQLLKLTWLNNNQHKTKYLVKALFRYDYYTTSSKLYKETQIINIVQTYKYNVCILAKDIHSHIIFKNKSNVQKRVTRQVNNICLPLSLLNSSLF